MREGAAPFSGCPGSALQLLLSYSNSPQSAPHPPSLSLQCQLHFLAGSRGWDSCLVAVQAWFPLTVPHLGLVAQDVGQICELKQVLFVPLCICDVPSDVLVTRNNVARGIAENEAVGDLQRVLFF